MRLGVKFARATAFVPPRQIIVNGKTQNIRLPDESGVAATFIELLLDDCYGLYKLPRSIETILDIGANVGLFGLAARNVFPDATIHAYEPNRPQKC